MIDDDFAALGTDKGLDVYEHARSRPSDLKRQSRAGEEEHDSHDIRSLHGVLRNCSDGLRYESGRMHSHLLKTALAVDDPNRHGTTSGQKWAEDFENGPAVREDNAVHASTSPEHRHLDYLSCASITPRVPIERMRKRESRVCHALSYSICVLMTLSVGTRYSPTVRSTASTLVNVYLLGLCLAAWTKLTNVQCRPCVNCLTVQMDTRNSSQLPWARSGMHREERDPKNIRAALKHTLCEEAASQKPTSDIHKRLCAASPKRTKALNNAAQKRIGAKTVNNLERLQTRGGNLQAEDATIYRALAANANDLAMDMPELSSAAKELRNEFSTPAR